MKLASHLILSGVLTVGAVGVAASAANAETLQEALTAAYLNNPDLTGERANLRATDEGVPQALSGWRPTVTLTGEAGRERLESRGRSEDLDPISGSATVTQPLYRGGRTRAETDSAEALVEAGRENLRSVEQDTFLDVITAYMDVLRDEAVVQLNGNNVKVLRRELEASEDRFRVGEVTRTDVAQAEARLARAVSDLEAAEGELISSRATYTRVIGNVPTDLQPPPPLPEPPASEETAVEIALNENPAILAAMRTEESSMHDIRVASGQLLPTLSLEGQATHSQDTVTRDSNSESYSVVGQLSIPLYQSGVVYSQVREARQVNNLRRIQIEDARRAVRESTVQAWEGLQTARAQIISNREQVRANQIALEGVIQEAQVGSRTTLDVLDAEQELLDAQVDLVRTERNEYVAAFGLQAAIGRLSFESLGLTVDPYDPSANYSRVRNKWFGTDGGLN